MNTALKHTLVAMATAALGFAGGCNKSESPEATEASTGGEEATEASCGGEGSCGGSHEGTEGGMEEGAEASGEEGASEASCGEGSCG